MSTTRADVLAGWLQGQKPQLHLMNNSSTFSRNLEQALDTRRAEQACYTSYTSAWKAGQGIDLCSNDILSLGATGQAGEAFLAELARHPQFNLYSGGSRVLDGNYRFLEQVEREAAEFHGTEAGLIVGSGYEANVAIYTAVPRPGDAIVFDELVHASVHDGMSRSPAQCRVPFLHNDVDAFRDAMMSVYDSQPLLRDGKNCVLVSVESVYSMDGDVCPLADMIDVAKEVFPAGNVVWIVDEAHATGILGPNGAGLVKQWGLEGIIDIQLVHYGKAMACTGAAILGSRSVRAALMNFAPSIIYTTAPSFATVAAIRASYSMLTSGATKKAQENIQELAKHFFQTITSNDVWDEANDTGILSVPLADDWDLREFQVHIIAVHTKQQYNYWLNFHLQLAGFCVFPIDFPTVPHDQCRNRIMLHGANSRAEVEAVANAICAWAKEMILLEKERPGKPPRLPKAAQKVYAMASISN